MKFFELIHQDKNSGARAGIIHTAHGEIETPIFMPVGTQATVKTLDSQDIENIGAQIILGNTYHLHLRPGEDLISEIGGLHKFMNWKKPILTDSGGFQVFSLGLQKEAQEKKDQGKLVSIDDEGVTFQSHLDGSKHRFTPEASIDIQHKLGADIIMAFDECTPDEADVDYTKKALTRTHRWAKQSLEAHQKNTTYHGYQQFLFGIIQGAQHKHLREESARYISSLDFDGIAIGGESIGYNMEATAEILDWIAPLIPENKPHYAMGVGLNPVDLLIAVEHGVDMFDCVAPTRLARHGMLYVKDKAKKHRLNIKNASFIKDTKPIDEYCSCSTCKNYSRSYLHHLFAADEMTGMRLASIHNLFFLLQLMEQTRNSIKENQFMRFKNEWI
jgi:queuine tRNA-ribosyltransferase